jgi:aerobic-type carbon monoxide dehydrogenase small subunit (CoxS/CutS family)
MKDVIQFKFNGMPVTVNVSKDRSLLWIIRNNLNMTGTKYGCGLGHCGSCTVLVNKKATRACMVTGDFVIGKEILTIEGLAKNDRLNPVQEAFVQHDALQCGFCTPGMIMNACGLLYENPEPSRQEIIDGMEDNLCRCGSHIRVIKAIESAAKTMKGGQQL